MKYTGIPKSTMIIPGHVYVGLKIKRSTDIADAHSTYSAGMIGNPKALYGRSAFGCFFRRMKIPMTVKM